jgi:hypothetical protein
MFAGETDYERGDLDTFILYNMKPFHITKAVHSTPAIYGSSLLKCKHTKSLSKITIVG